MSNIVDDLSKNESNRKESQNGKIKVLHIDDDDAVLCISKAYIELLGKGRIKVDSLQDPTRTLNTLKTNEYNVIISDYKMAKLDGPTLVDIIMKAGIKLPIIMFTGGGREEDLDEVLNSRVDYYITKSINVKAQFQELVDVVFELHKQKEIVDSF